MSLGTVADIEKFGQFKQFLKRSEADFGEKIIVFLIDEFEELQQRVADGQDVEVGIQQYPASDAA